MHLHNVVYNYSNFKQQDVQSNIYRAEQFLSRCRITTNNTEFSSLALEFEGSDLCILTARDSDHRSEVIYNKFVLQTSLIQEIAIPSSESHLVYSETVKANLDVYPIVFYSNISIPTYDMGITERRIDLGDTIINAAQDHIQQRVIPNLFLHDSRNTGHKLLVAIDKNTKLNIFDIYRPRINETEFPYTLEVESPQDDNNQYLFVLFPAIGATTHSIRRLTRVVIDGSNYNIISNDAEPVAGSTSTMFSVFRDNYITLGDGKSYYVYRTVSPVDISTESEHDIILQVVTS